MKISLDFIFPSKHFHLSVCDASGWIKLVLYSIKWIQRVWVTGDLFSLVVTVCVAGSEGKMVRG